MCEDEEQQHTVCAGIRKTTKQKQQTVYAQIKGRTIATTNHNNIQFMDGKQKTRETKDSLCTDKNFYLTYY